MRGRGERGGLLQCIGVRVQREKNGRSVRYRRVPWSSVGYRGGSFRLPWDSVGCREKPAGYRGMHRDTMGSYCFLAREVERGASRCLLLLVEVVEVNSSRYVSGSPNRGDRAFFLIRKADHKYVREGVEMFSHLVFEL